MPCPRAGQPPEHLGFTNDEPQGKHFAQPASKRKQDRSILKIDEEFKCLKAVSRVPSALS